jgi:DDE domain
VWRRCGRPAWHRTERYANNQVGCDHGRPKARLRPVRGLEQDRRARLTIAGHALVRNVRRGHDELAVEAPANRRLAVAFDELVGAPWSPAVPVWRDARRPSAMGRPGSSAGWINSPPKAAPCPLCGG